MSHPLTVKPASARSGMSRCKKTEEGPGENPCPSSVFRIRDDGITPVRGFLSPRGCIAQQRRGSRSGKGRQEAAVSGPNSFGCIRA